MIKVYREISIDNFEGWSGAEDTIDKIREADKIDALDNFLEEEYPDGVDETQLNDLFRFDGDWVLGILGIPTEDEEED